MSDIHIVNLTWEGSTKGWKCQTASSDTAAYSDPTTIPVGGSLDLSETTSAVVRVKIRNAEDESRTFLLRDSQTVASSSSACFRIGSQDNVAEQWNIAKSPDDPVFTIKQPTGKGTKNSAVTEESYYITYTGGTPKWKGGTTSDEAKQSAISEDPDNPAVYDASDDPDGTIVDLRITNSSASAGTFTVTNKVTLANLDSNTVELGHHESRNNGTSCSWEVYVGTADNSADLTINIT